MADIPDMVEIVIDGGVGDYSKGDIVRSDRFPDNIEQLLANGMVTPSERKTEKIADKPDQPLDWGIQSHPGAAGPQNV